MCTFVVGAEPLLQGHLVDAEVSGDLRQRDTGFAVAGHADDDVVAELAGLGLGHSDILSACRAG
ncbi:hypothetical protein GCM10027174_29730 [Salinifilum aidingensis]